MIFGLFKKKTLPKKVLIINTIPHNIEKIREYAVNEDSDFIRSLHSQYCTESVDDLWKKYKKTAGLLEHTLKVVSDRGATIIDDATLQDIEKINHFEIIILIAHHSNNSDEIEFQGKLNASKHIITKISSNFNGVIDITSCYSAFLLPKIKATAPNSSIIGIDIATSLPFRLLLLDETLRILCQHKDYSYKDALIKALGKLPSAPDITSIKDSSSAVHLGNEKLKSTAFAPKEAEKGDDFLVSVFIHKPEESHEVELMARVIDENSYLQNSKALSIKISEGDRIDFQLSCAGSNAGDFIFDENKKGLIWDGEMASVEFCISVSADCKKKAFVGKLQFAVNKEPAGEMMFKTLIVDKINIPIAKECTELHFISYNHAKEQQESEDAILSKLEEQHSLLQEELKGYAIGDKMHEKLSLDISICEKCIELISESKQKPKQKMLKVFISSTSDLKNYRQVIREQVESCEMFPDMYERWGQGNDYPRDMCCQHVLDSDIFVCLLGAKYGFVEPAWGMSMTEIEFRVAMKSGKPILVYILNHYKEEMEKLLPEQVSLVELQNKLIDELREKRMVGFFSNEMNLALLSVTELLTLKHTLS